MGDFARLIPVTPLARRAFHDVVAKIQTNDDRLKHARRFIYFEESTASTSNEEVNEEEEEQEEKPHDSVVWKGYYRLNLDIAPYRKHLGWVIGSSRAGLNEYEVDILLTAEPGQFNVRGRHARLSHLPDSGVLMIYAHPWPVLVDGKHNVRNAAYALCDTVGLTFGDPSYVLEFTDLEPHVYQSQLASYYKDVSSNSMPLLMTPTPTPTLKTLPEAKYYVAPAHAGGVSSTVSRAFVKSSGMAVAMKRMKRVSASTLAIQNEVELLKRLDHPNICKLIEAIGYERSSPFGHNECDEVILVLQPFAPALSRHIGLHDRSWLVDVFRQCIAGLAYLHALPVMHRDIKLDNIGIVYTHPPRAVLMDFGHATSATESSNHMRGTLRYLAPEVLDLKARLPSASPYNHKVDIWAIGVCLYECVVKGYVQWSSVSRNDYDQMLESMGRFLQGPQSGDAGADEILTNILQSTLVWEPALRAPAADILFVISEQRMETASIGPNSRSDKRALED